MRVKAAARTAGFDAAGICDLRPITRGALARWLANGYGGAMRYLHRQAKRREQPQKILPAAHRAVVVLKNHYQRPPTATPPAARVARYAWGEDYHRVLADQLGTLADALIGLGSTPTATRWFADAGPVPERELAERAGLGWIGKNTMLIHPTLGSFTFIGTVFTDLDLPVDPPSTTDRCGRCRRCLDACPTKAFPALRVLDARRCISYLTIEHRGAFDAAQGAMIDDWLFGCDVCQDVCPWNDKFTRETIEPRFAPRTSTQQPDPEALISIDSESHQREYADTAFERPGAQGIARNARQVLANRAPRARR